MRLKGVIRRAWHLSIITIWFGMYRKLQWPRTPEKHYKIDDEEHLIGGNISRKLPNLIAVMIKLSILFFGIMILVMSLIYMIYKPPIVLIKYFQWRYPNVIFHLSIPSSLKVVAITLDDAPSSETAKMLDLLNIYNAKATFFVIGEQISEYPKIMQRIQDEGHEIGIHGWADEPSYKLPVLEVIRQIKQIETLLPSDSTRQKWFRPGSGWFTKSMVEELGSIGYKVALGSIYPHDPQIKFPKVNAAHVLSMLRPGGVIIMHDRRPYSAEQLELVLQGLVKNKWRAQTLDQVHSMMENFVGGRIS